VDFTVESFVFKMSKLTNLLVLYQSIPTRGAQPCLQISEQTLHPLHPRRPVPCLQLVSMSSLCSSK
jgi:hypothetical protein